MLPLRTLAWISVLAVVVAVGATSWLIFKTGWRWDEKLVAEGDALAAAALFFVVEAAVVAVYAYRAAIGVPELAVQVYLPPSGIVNKPVVRHKAATAGEPLVKLERPPLSSLQLLIWIENKSQFAARNPVVIVELVGFADLSEEQAPGWHRVPGPSGTSDALALALAQWEGGAIHGKSKRSLSELNLDGLLVSTSGQPRVVVDAVADSYPRRRLANLEVQLKVVKD